MIKLTDIDVDSVESRLISVEKMLEQIGREICDAEGSGECWNELNKALCHLRNGLGVTYRMRNN